MNLKPITFLSEFPFEFNILKLNDSLVRSEIGQLDIDCLFKTDFGKNLSKSKEFSEFFTNDYEKFWLEKLKTAHNEIDFVNDKLLLFYILLIKNKELEPLDSFNDNTLENNKYLKTILRIWIQIYQTESKFSEYLLHDSIHNLFVNAQHWRELIHLCDIAFEFKLSFLYDSLIQLFTSKLVLDLTLSDVKQKSNCVQALTSQNSIDELTLLKANGNISELAKYMPRVKSSLDKNSRIGRECAESLNSYKKFNPDLEPNEYKKSKILSYNHYRKVLTNLTHFLNSLNGQYFEKTNPRYNLYLARGDKTMMEFLMAAPLSDAIINPVINSQLY